MDAPLQPPSRAPTIRIPFNGSRGPTVGIELWAWELTPLTARVVGAVLTLPGAVDVWLLVDDRWTSFRWMFQAQLASLVLINAAWIVERGDLLWDRPLAWLFAGGVAGALVVYAGLYAWLERPSRVRTA